VSVVAAGWLIGAAGRACAAVGVVTMPVKSPKPRASAANIDLMIVISC
jgi:hypothetical protein